ncbi:hypothetical protein BJ508DRAFT_110804 [Ascobolus immersus RN42]|uniref:Uncharacterized protein n=1 Tax=Ascobolus immersus RN42 TaxID=1160509 RepID=A0A3N4HDE4_ASCIM|nr:hypothetical protein BJ508DRAFT_110804 [Ascobolus immersus RN42]
MAYIRHLTSTQPPSPGDEPGTHGNWVYLNLITNMAQLHSLNVTRSFIKSAVQNYSSKLELSEDGSMIRWKNGAVSQDPSPPDNTPATAHAATSSPMEPSPLQPASVQASAGTLQSRSTSTLPPYVPLFAREDQDGSSADSSVVSSPAPSVAEEDRIGSVVYFGEAPFFLDFGFAPPAKTDAELVAEAELKEEERRRGWPAYRELLTVDWEGYSLDQGLADARPKADALQRGADQSSGIAPSDLFLDAGYDDDEEELHFIPTEVFPTALDPEPPFPPKPTPLKASGIGPVVLTDNYAVFTRIRYFSPYRPPQKVQEVRVDLPPSEMPPALFLMDDSESEMRWR